MASIWDRRITSRLIFIASVLMPMGAATAAERNMGVSSFESIRLEGPFRVVITTNKAPSARITGDMRAVDAVTLSANGTALTIRQSNANWGGMDDAPLGQAVIHLTTPALRRVVVLGSGDLHIDRVKAQALNIVLAGSGSLAIDRIEAVSLDGQLNGSGNMQLGGHAETAYLIMEGAGAINGSTLKTDHLKLRIDGNGRADVRAKTTAKVNMIGNGAVHIAGAAACTIENKGSGNIVCGMDAPDEDEKAKDEGNTNTPATPPAKTAKPAPTKAVISNTPDVHIHHGKTPN
ncbi:GIN domain-containing protein [Aquisediminimonas sediminicola]|uniref:GIN domain-containing protein n=1 Tax=Alteraquisediminimonas sediminicola TaxID=2676787 RepID=UPI001C8EE5E0|nr:DUF2807 domain-containing protein [Aquisediminimonas sediminicola]